MEKKIYFKTGNSRALKLDDDLCYNSWDLVWQKQIRRGGMRKNRNREGTVYWYTVVVTLHSTIYKTLGLNAVLSEKKTFYVKETFYLRCLGIKT